VRFSRSNPTAAVTIAYLSPAQGPLTCSFASTTTLMCPWWTRRSCRPALAARKMSLATPRRATFSSTRRWIGVRPATRPRADEVRVLPTGSHEWLIEREEASSADAVGQARAKRMRRTQVDRPARWHKLAVGVLGTATLCPPGVKLSSLHGNVIADAPGVNSSECPSQESDSL